LKNLILSRNEAETIVSDTLKKCDDGELYLENSKSESILLMTIR
jgi:TldD protein